MSKTTPKCQVLRTLSPRCREQARACSTDPISAARHSDNAAVRHARYVQDALRLSGAVMSDERGAHAQAIGGVAKKRRRRVVRDSCQRVCTAYMVKNAAPRSVALPVATRMRILRRMAWAVTRAFSRHTARQPCTAREPSMSDQQQRRM